MKKIASLTLALVLSLSVAASGGYAQAANNEKLSKDEIQEIKQGFAQYGVSPAVQDRLIQKIEQGEILDSMNPAMQDKGVTVESKKETANSLTETTKITYPDGSVRVHSVTRAKADASGISPDSVSGGLTQCGTGYCSVKGAKVEDSVILFSGDFLADYVLVDGDFNDYISSAYDHHVTAKGGTATNDSLTITRSHESMEGPARAALKFTWNAKNSSTSQTCYLFLYVGNNKAVSQQG